MQPVDGVPPVFALNLQGTNAVMELRGRAGPGAADMLDALLRAAVARRARQAIVDLTEADDVRADVGEVLARTRTDLHLLGGRLLVVGQEEREAVVGPHLLEAFAAYREVLDPRHATLPPSAQANAPSFAR